MSDASITPALITVIGSIGIGLMMIGAAMCLKLFKGPNEQNDDLARALAKIGDRVEKNTDDHHSLSRNVAVLTKEVSHLSSSVERLSDEVKYLRQGNPNGRSVRRAAAD